MDSMADNIQTNTKTTHIQGQSFQTKASRWAWITLLTTTVLLPILSLTVTRITNRRQHIALWKSSLLPFLWGATEILPEHDFESLQDVD